MEIISQTFKGVIPPTRIDHNNGDGRIVSIVDWADIADKHRPFSGENIQFEFVLEYLTVSCFFPTLLKIPATSYPQFSVGERELQKAAKTVEFKRNFPPDKNYSVQFLLWNWYNNSWRGQHFDRDYFFNAGMENRINLIKPYLVAVGDTIFGDIQHKLGISIAPRYLKEGDYLEISGGYSGSVSYLWEPPQIELIEGATGSQDITNTSVKVLNSNHKRAVLYVQNAGNVRVYFKFSSVDEWYQPYFPLLAESAPFLEPGQNLTYEHGKLFFNGGNNKDNLLQKYANTFCKLPLYAVCNGNSKLVYQELIFE